MKREIKIGLFTIAMILVVWGGVRFLSGIDLLSSNNDYYAIYSKIDGIQQASPVFIKGVKVGTVTALKLDEKDASQVELTLTVANKYKIPVDSEAKIFSNGLMSGKAVELILGESSEYVEPNGNITSSQEKDLFAAASSEIDYLKGRFETIATELTTTLSNINTLLENNTGNIGGLISNLNQISQNLNTLLKNNEGNVTTMLSGFAEVSDTLGKDSAQIDSIIRNVNSLTAELNEAQLGSALSSSLTQIEKLITQLNSEEGNLGKIMNDEALYTNLASASANLDALLYDVKANPKRYVNISVFGTNEEKAKAKAEKRAQKDAEEAAKDLRKAEAKAARK
ncbi:MAG: MlaD family protein [Rikenellaceae bacterium]